MTSEGTNMYMPVAPAYGNGGMGGFGDFGGGWGFILLLIVLCGWGGFGGGFGGGYGNGMFPWMMAGQTNSNNDVQRGFDQAALMTGITGVQNAVTSGFGDVATQLCGGFAGVNASINGAQNAIAQQLYGNTIADMERSFGVQTAITGVGTNTLSGLADVKYAIATEGANTRAAGTANTQAIMDKLCQLELDGIKAELASAQRENISLQNQLNMAALRESQTAQNAFIQQGLNNEVDALYNRLSNCPVPSTPVYGRTPIFTCGGNGCGCGMAA